MCAERGDARCPEFQAVAWEAHELLLRKEPPAVCSASISLSTCEKFSSLGARLLGSPISLLWFPDIEHSIHTSLCAGGWPWS